MFRRFPTDHELTRVPLFADLSRKQLGLASRLSAPFDLPAGHVLALIAPGDLERPPDLREHSDVHRLDVGAGHSTGTSFSLLPAVVHDAGPHPPSVRVLVPATTDACT